MELDQEAPVPVAGVKRPAASSKTGVSTSAKRTLIRDAGNGNTARANFPSRTGNSDSEDELDMTDVLSFRAVPHDRPVELAILTFDMARPLSEEGYHLSTVAPAVATDTYRSQNNPRIAMNEFLNEHGMERMSGGALTHTTFNGSPAGGKFHIGHADRDRFLHLYFRLLEWADHQSHGTLMMQGPFLNEIAPAVLRFYVDIDMSDDIFDRLAEIIGGGDSLKTYQVLATAITNTLKNITDFEEIRPAFSRRRKGKLHYQFPGIIVAKQYARAFAESARNDLKCMFPGFEMWDSIFDLGVYNSGLRMLGSRKHQQDHTGQPVYKPYNLESNEELKLTADILDSYLIHPHPEKQKLAVEEAQEALGIDAMTGGSVPTKWLGKMRIEVGISEETVDALMSLVDGLRDQSERSGPFSGHTLSIRKITGMTAPKVGFFILLSDRHCPFVERQHKRKTDYLFLNVTSNGVCMSCFDEKCKGSNFPSDRVPLPPATREALFNERSETLGPIFTSSNFNYMQAGRPLSGAGPIVEEPDDIGAHISGGDSGVSGSAINRHARATILKSKTMQEQLLRRVISEKFDAAVVPSSGLTLKQTNVMGPVISAKTNIERFQDKKGPFRAFVDMDAILCGLEAVDSNGKRREGTTQIQVVMGPSIVNFIQHIHVIVNSSECTRATPDMGLTCDLLGRCAAFRQLWDKIAALCPIERGMEALSEWIASDGVGNRAFGKVLTCLDASRKVVCVGVEKHSWWLWNETRWQPSSATETQEFVAELAVDFVVKLSKALATLAAEDESVVQPMRDKLSDMRHKHLMSTVGCATVLAGLQTQPSTLKGTEWVGQLDSKKNLVAFSDGSVYDIETNSVRRAEPEDFIRTTLPLRFDPVGMCDQSAIKELQEFLSQFFCCKYDERDYFLLRIARALFGIPEQTMFAGLGDGSNGKSKLMEFLKLVLGGYLVKIESAILLDKGRASGNEATTALNALVGARIAYFCEVPSDRKFDLDLYKQIVGGETMRLRELFKESFETIIKVFLMMMANEMPELPNTTSTARRVVVQIFDAVFTDQRDKVNESQFVYLQLGDKALAQKMARLGHAMIGQIIRMARDYHEKTMQDPELSNVPPPASLIENRNAELSKFDLWSRFRDENYIRQARKYVLYKDVYDDLEQWCRERRQSTWFEKRAKAHEEQLKRVFNQGAKRRDKQDRCGDGNKFHGYGGWAKKVVSDPATPPVFPIKTAFAKAATSRTHMQEATWCCPTFVDLSGVSGVD